MGEPDDVAQFRRFQAEDLTIFIARALFDRLEPGAMQMPFYISGYGRFWLCFAEPWGASGPAAG